MKLRLFLLSFFFSLSFSTFAEKHSGPNALIILADDLGYSDLGCYGGEIETPNLDALAKEGLRFSQFYNTARCWPTRASMMTGYYAQQVNRDKIAGRKFGGNRGGRPSWAKLLPELLKPAGYRSYHSGKWHIDGKPMQTGFDRSYVVSNHGFFRLKFHYLDGVKQGPTEVSDDFYVTDAIADHAVDILREHEKKHAESPFMHFLAFTAPHFPLHAKPADIERYRKRYRAGWDEMRAKRHARQKELGFGFGELSEVEGKVGPPYDFPDAYKILGEGEVKYPDPWDELTDAQKTFQADKMAAHAAMVDSMDQGIGRVLEQIKKMGEWEDTLVLFLSDNGASAEIMVRGTGTTRRLRGLPLLPTCAWVRAGRRFPTPLFGCTRPGSTRAGPVRLWSLIGRRGSKQRGGYPTGWGTPSTWSPRFSNWRACLPKRKPDRPTRERA